jgi:hypothetical protein
MQGHARRIRLRHLMHQMIALNGSLLPLGAITGEFMGSRN